MISTVLFVIGWVAFVFAALANLYGFVVASLDLDWQTRADMAAVIGLGMYAEALIFALAGR